MAIKMKLLAELDEIYGNKASSTFQDGLVVDYTTKPFIRGAYSYSTIGIENSREIAAQDIDNKLFFAGEAMNLNGHHQSVHGAMETGYEKVVKILGNS